MRWVQNKPIINMRCNPQQYKQQTGAVLILIAFILGLGAAAFLIQSFAMRHLQIKQDEKTYQALNEAKAALIAYAVSHPKYPGQLPFPDRNDDLEGYDGKSDCYTGTFDYRFLIGQLPIYGQTSPCLTPYTGLGGDWRDAQGNRLWYAVSRNLVHEYQSPVVDPVINPDTANLTDNWITVVDRNGNVISNRVAAVIIAPGNPIGSQDRTGAAPNPDQFLDRIIRTSDNKPFKNYGYPLNAVQVNAFIMGEDSRNMSTADTQFLQPYYFNDKLIFITIDELIQALSLRAATDASHLLNAYQAKTGQYPDAANLGTTSYIAVSGNQKGFLPIDVTDNCSCSSANSCTCSFKPLYSVVFTHNVTGYTWASVAGSCTRSTNTCNCKGAGNCVNGADYFKCDVDGLCTHNLTGTNQYSFTAPDYADIASVSGNCTIISGKAVCTDAGTFAIGLAEPTWFKESKWQDYLYYQWSNTNNLHFDTRKPTSAILIMAGKSLTSELGIIQTRPSSDIKNYLDSTENTNNDASFEAMNKSKSNSYNDQPFIVSP